MSQSAHRHVALLVLPLLAAGAARADVFAWSRPGRFLRETGPHVALRYLELALQYQF